MENVFKSSDKIGDIVSKFPKAGEIFREYHVDFCCGGNRPLSEAIKEQGIDEKAIIQKINNTYEAMKDSLKEDKNWVEAPYGELIDYVVNTHHAYLQSELPLVSEYVTKILRVHGANHGEVLSKVHKLFHNLKMELEQHLIKEEEVLFPIIKKYEKEQNTETLAKAHSLIHETEAEHDEAGNIIKEMRRVTEDYKLPEDACRTFALTYRKLEEIEADLFKHIHLENNILFPRVEREAEEKNV